MKYKKIKAAGIIPIHPESNSILMIQRNVNQSYPGLWSFFGGKFEKEDKCVKNTAKREFKEESGIESIEYKISSKPIYVNDNNHVVFYNYAGVFYEQFVPDLKKQNEAQDYKWFSIEELPNEMHPGAIEFFNKKKGVIIEIIRIHNI